MSRLFEHATSYDRIGAGAWIARRRLGALDDLSYVCRMHELPLLTTLALAFGTAWICGLVTQWLRLSPIVGYLIAGILIGPHTPGFVGDVHLAQQLAEVGVILLMFGVGLHFELRDLLGVKSVAIPGAIGQTVVAALLGLILFTALGLERSAALVIGSALAVASTVMLTRVLLDAHSLHTSQGHVAIGWLLVEDIITVIILVLIPLFAPDSLAEATPQAVGWAVLLALLNIGGLVALIGLAGSRIIPSILVRVARLRSRQLFTLTVLVLSLAIAVASAHAFGTSMALGAFLAGTVVGQSPASQQAAADALPLRDAFSVLFFVSVGMLFDPSFLIQEPILVLTALAIILIAKPLTALVIVAALGHPARTALTVAVGLAQIGEFSFILSELARQHGIMPSAGHNILVASAIISLSINPPLFRALDKLEACLKRIPMVWNALNARADRKLAKVNLAASASIAQSPAEQRLAIVVGFGPVGRAVEHLLRSAGLRTVVIDMNMDTVLSLGDKTTTALFGDASRQSVLEKAGIETAHYLVLSTPHSSETTAIVTLAKELNPRVRVLIRSHYLRQRRELEEAGADGVIYEEAEAAVALAKLVLRDTGAGSETVQREIHTLLTSLDKYSLGS